MKAFLRLLLLLCIAPSAFAQLSLEPIRCYTVEYNQYLRNKFPGIPSKEDFEKTMSAQMKSAKSDPLNNGILRGVLKIPVIVHVVHFGEAVGSGANIAAAQVYSQLEVMNEDFRRQAGTLGFNDDSRGADVEVEFVPALVDPQGNLLPEPGIHRYKGPLPAYVFDDIDILIKPATIYDPTRYLNMWTVNFAALLLGYAQFPDPAHGLASGVGCNTGGATTDGVVMGYNAFGSRAKYPSGTYQSNYDLGRTVTHEVGHWLGLRHIWGDGGCEVDDYCGDTPNAGSASSGCPVGKSSCGALDMYQNYMDYSFDKCMNIFTKDQTLRMRTVLTKSARRRELISSTVHLAPVALDAAIIDIVSPRGESCNRSVTPEVLLRNLGQATLTSATIKYHLDNGPVRTYQWSGSLKTSEIALVKLPAIQAKDGSQNITVFVITPNGSTDARTFNDQWSDNFVISRSGVKLDFAETFESGLFPSSNKWKIENDDRCESWSPVSNIVGADGGTTSATFLNYYEYNASGTKDALQLPLINLNNAENPVLEFHVAHSQTDNSNDRLEVFVSVDCGTTYEKLFDKSGAALATTAPASDAFYPTTAGHWRKESISLSNYRSGQVLIKLVGTNNYGDNIFVDNISVSNSASTATVSATSPTNTIAEQSLRVSRIYPNPSNGNFEVDFTSTDGGKAEAQLISSNGSIAYAKSIMAHKGLNRFEVSAGGLAKGFYFLLLKTGSGLVKEKVLIK